MGSLPSLIVQAFVILETGDQIQLSDVQTASLVTTSCMCAIDILHHNKYVHTNTRNIYLALTLRSMVNVIIRTVLVAYLISIIRMVMYAWTLISFIGAGCLYLIGILISRRLKRDTPIKGLLKHWLFGCLIAVHLLFVSLPFAPSHALVDWWRGYLLCELKIQLENVLMTAILLKYVSEHYEQDDFLSVLFFALSIALFNAVSLWLLHQNVKKQLRLRNVYSCYAIVKLYSDLFKHLSSLLKLRSGSNGDDMRTICLPENARILNSQHMTTQINRHFESVEKEQNQLHSPLQSPPYQLQTETESACAFEPAALDQNAGQHSVNMNDTQPLATSIPIQSDELQAELSATPRRSTLPPVHQTSRHNNRDPLLD